MAMLPVCRVAVLLLAVACGTDTRFEPDGSPDRLGVWVVPAQATVLRTDISGLHAPTFAVVADTGAWRRVWDQTWADASVVPPLPPLDFVLASVVVVGIGDRVGRGYSVSIDSVVTFTSGPVLYATASLPGTQCPPTPGLSAPVHMIGVAEHPTDLAWQVTTVRGACPP
jgi:hypothetical protein